MPPQMPHPKPYLDQEIEPFGEMGKEAIKTGRQVVRLGVALLFIIAVMAYTAIHAGGLTNNWILIIAAMVGGYMAMNIGANDVANNVGPAVGSKALTMGGALVIAAVCEAAGALLAGGDVVSTISKGIIDPALIPNTDTFVYAMLASLFAAAIWVNLATYVGAPVSTTHAVVGGVTGAGVAAAGWNVIHWDTMGQIALSWVVSPLLGGAIAAGFLLFIKRKIIFQQDMIAAARRYVPPLVAIMGGVFAAYLAMKGLKHIWKAPVWALFVSGIGTAFVVYSFVKPAIHRKASLLENRREEVARLFTIPLVFAAALLSFAHGANDVANAIGPLAAIVSALKDGTIATKVGVPGWVMWVGATGIALGLALYGPKLIKRVGEEITELDRIRAYCIALAAAITVLIASALGLPVSSTHIALGGVFGVGFLREWLMAKDHQRQIDLAAAGGPPEGIDPGLWRAAIAAGDLDTLDHLREGQPLSKNERKAIKRVRKRALVRRAST